MSLATGAVILFVETARVVGRTAADAAVADDEKRYVGPATGDTSAAYCPIIICIIYQRIVSGDRNSSLFPYYVSIC